MNFVRIFVAPAVLAVGAFAAGVIGQGTAFAASAEKGKAAYIQYGCWQCHDFAGEGAVTSNGKVLARTPLPLDAFIAFVRTTRISPTCTRICNRCRSRNRRATFRCSARCARSSSVLARMEPPRALATTDREGQILLHTCLAGLLKSGPLAIIAAVTPNVT
jgi:hypothetical protein